MQGSFFILSLGFIIGLKHAIEADHLIAVTTLVSEHKNPFRSALIGTFWGIGHTTTLFLIGLGVLLLNISIPQNISLFFEMLVGVMLILLGLRAIRGGSYKIHEHKHKHGESEHIHLHHRSHHHAHKRSFIVGMIHGVAGSGALMLLVLATIKSFLLGIYYILLFGLGSIVGMTILSLFIGLPFAFTATRFQLVEKYLRIVAGVISIVFGLSLVYTIAILLY